MSAHSLVAEQNVIGSCLIDDQAFWSVSDLLTGADFFDARNRFIWQAISALAALKHPLDVVTLGDALASKGLTEQAGGAEYIYGLARDTASAYNARAYAEIVAAKSLERRVVDAGARIAMLSGQDALQDAQEILGGVCDNIASPTVSAAGAMKALVKIMREQTERTTDMLGVPTGLPMLDDMTAGLREGDLVLIAGRPSMGKSLLAMQLALHAAQSGSPAHVVTLEMPTHQCLQRMISAVSNVPFERVMDAKKLEECDWHRVAIASEQVGKLPLYFDDDVYDLPKILARIRQSHAAHGTRVVVVDYLSFMRMPKAERNDLAVQAITRELKATAKALKITIILVAQLNRSLEQRSDKRPVMSDLRESGAIEQDADVILMPYRDEYYNPKSQHAGYAEILVRKQRNGRTGMVPLRTRLDVQRFEAAPEGLPELRLEDAPKPALSRGYSSAKVREIGYDRMTGND